VSPDFPSLADLSIRASSSAEQIAEALIGAKATSRTGSEVRFRGKGSLSVVTAGAQRGSFYDHEAGVGGDIIDLVAHLRRCSIAEAAAWVRAFLGIDGNTPARPAAKAAPQAPEVPTDPPDAVKIEEARGLWHGSVPIDDTRAEAYLRGRGTDPDQLPAHTGLAGWPPTLRWHAGIGALLVAVNDTSTGLIVAVQRIYLTRDGAPKRRPDGRKIKLALGPTGNGNAVRFAWQPDPAGRWGVAEGAETALAAAQLFGLPVVASLGASNMAKVAPPIWATTVIVFADHDDAGLRAAKETAAALAARELPVVIRRPSQPGQDYADVLLARAEAA
jgi:hypothetical protein